MRHGFKRSACRLNGNRRPSRQSGGGLVARTSTEDKQNRSSKSRLKEKAMTQYVCPRCPRTVSENDRYCSGCGSSLESSYFSSACATASAINAGYFFAQGSPEFVAEQRTTERPKTGEEASPAAPVLFCLVLVLLLVSSI